MRDLRIGVLAICLLMLAVTENVAAQMLPGAASGASEHELAGIGIGNPVPVPEVWCDYSLTLNDVPRKATLEFEVTASVTQYYYVGDVFNYSCACTVEPTGCRYAPTEIVLDIQPDGTRTVSGSQCAPKSVMKWNADGTAAPACPRVWLPIVPGSNEITNTKWNAVLYGSHAAALLAQHWREAIEENRDPNVVVADILCNEDCGALANLRQSAESFGRCDGTEPASYIYANGFCPMPNVGGALGVGPWDRF